MTTRYRLRDREAVILISAFGPFCPLSECGKHTSHTRSFEEKKKENLSSYFTGLQGWKKNGFLTIVPLNIL